MLLQLKWRTDHFRLQFPVLDSRYFLPERNLRVAKQTNLQISIRCSGEKTGAHIRKACQKEGEGAADEVPEDIWKY